jgi:hypothetical protein
MTKMRKEKTFLIVVEITNTKEIQGIISDYFENIYLNKLENLE